MWGGRCTWLHNQIPYPIFFEPFSVSLCENYYWNMYLWITSKLWRCGCSSCTVSFTISCPPSTCCDLFLSTQKIFELRILQDVYYLIHEFLFDKIEMVIVSMKGGPPLTKKCRRMSHMAERACQINSEEQLEEHILGLFGLVYDCGTFALHSMTRDMVTMSGCDKGNTHVMDAYSSGVSYPFLELSLSYSTSIPLLGYTSSTPRSTGHTNQLWSTLTWST